MHVKQHDLNFFRGWLSGAGGQYDRLNPSTFCWVTLDCGSEIGSFTRNDEITIKAGDTINIKIEIWPKMLINLFSYKPLP